MVELKGSLGGIGLPAIVQLIGELHHTGTLQLVRGDATGRLDFDDGRLVAAEIGQTHGLQALAALAHDFGDADFTFVEGADIGERTLDLGAADLKRLLERAQNGHLSEPDDATFETGLEEQPQPCPLLGFADDRSRHYSRPTALHRCYAGRGPSLVTAQEQRELCLAGRYAACPRYRNAEPIQLVSPGAADTPTVQVQPRPMPPGVAARVAAAAQMRVSPPPAQTAADVPTWIGHPKPAPSEPLAEPPPEPTPPNPSRGVLLIGGGVALGLVVVAVALVVLMPALNSGLTPRAATPAFEPVQATRVPAPAAKPTSPPVVIPTSVPTPVPSPTSPPPTPTLAPKPTVAVAGGQALMDVRFAAGPPANWLDNPPFAAWSDGAYRIVASQAARFVAVGVPTNRVLSDIVVSGTFRKTGGPPGGGYGLIVRDQGPEPRDGVNQDANAYVAEAGDLGEFGVWRRDGDHWVDLVPWTRSASVRPGGSPNELTVRAVGEHLVFIVNGAQLADVQDDALMAGGVGIFVGGDYNEVAVDHFAVQLPESL
jgi:hypothetical protein